MTLSVSNNGNLSATDFDELGFPTNDLVAYYPFVGNANDNYGNKLNASVSGATQTTNRFGTPNSAYNFSTSTDTVSATGFGGVFTQAGTYSVALWVYLNSTASNMNVWNFGGGSANRHNLLMDSASFYYQLYNGTSYVGKNGTNLGLNTWHNVVCTNNNRTVDLYINGVLATSTGAGYAVTTTGNILYFGYPGSITNGSRAIDGYISDVKIYSRVLTQAEVIDTYNHELGRLRLHNDNIVTIPEFVEDSSISVQMRNKKAVLITKGELISI